MLALQQEERTGNTKDIDIIVPVLNEREALPVFWERLSALSCFHRCRVTFIDNASSDGSLAFLRSLDGVQLIEHERNEGYGGSLLQGLRMTNLPNIIIIDADCEYPPEIIPELVRALAEHNIVYASRLAGKTSCHQAGMPWLKMWGNQMITGLFNILFHQRCTDLYTGCKALRRSALKNISLKRTGFEHVLELAVQLSCRGYRIQEVEVNFSPRTGGKSKMSHISETAKFLYWVLRYRWHLRHLLAVPS